MLLIDIKGKSVFWLHHRVAKLSSCPVPVTTLQETWVALQFFASYLRLGLRLILKFNNQGLSLVSLPQRRQPLTWSASSDPGNWKLSTSNDTASKRGSRLRFNARLFIIVNKDANRTMFICKIQRDFNWTIILPFRNYGYMLSHVVMSAQLVTNH